MGLRLGRFMLGRWAVGMHCAPKPSFLLFCRGVYGLCYWALLVRCCPVDIARYIGTDPSSPLQLLFSPQATLRNAVMGLVGISSWCWSAIQTAKPPTVHGEPRLSSLCVSWDTALAKWALGAIWGGTSKRSARTALAVPAAELCRGRQADNGWAVSEDAASFFKIFGLYWSIRKIPEWETWYLKSSFHLPDLLFSGCLPLRLPPHWTKGHFKDI